MAAPPMTAEEYLRADIGSLLMQLLFQTAVLKAENAALKAQLEAARSPVSADDHVGSR